MAIRLDSSTIRAMAGIRLAISSSAICGGDSIDPGAASRLRIMKLTPSVPTSITPLATVAQS